MSPNLRECTEAEAEAVELSDRGCFAVADRDEELVESRPRRTDIVELAHDLLAHEVVATCVLLLGRGTDRRGCRGP